MLSESAQKRRMVYKRSHTLPGLPVHISEDQLDEDGVNEQSRLLLTVGDSPSMSPETSSEIDKSDIDDELRPLQDTTKTKNKRLRFQYQRSYTVSNVTSEDKDLSNSNEKLSSTTKNRRNYNTSSKNPTMILSKVKDRIRKTVFHASEWPNAAAMVHDKRQRDIAAIEASYSSREGSYDQIQMKDFSKGRPVVKQAFNRETNNKNPNRDTSKNNPKDRNLKYDSMKKRTVSTPDQRDDIARREAVRTAFRRRSISEDTYDRPGPGPSLLEANAGVGGIICSNEDLQSILCDHKKKRSPRPNRRFRRTQSMDCSRLNKVSLETHMSSISVGSRTSTGSSFKSTRSDSESDTPRSSSGVTICVHPEPILDQQVRDRLAIFSQDEEDEDEEPQPKEIVFDENGQTWDVYGADFDPEVLGFAIQKHLEKLMESPEEEMNDEAPIIRPTKQVTEETKLKTQNSHDREEPGESEGSFWYKLLCLFSEREISSP